MKNYEDFLSKYTRKENHLDPNAGWDGCLFETFGLELEYIVSLYVHPALDKKIWTLIEGEHETLHLVAGYHVVDRVGFFVTEEDWEDEAEEYEVFGEEDWDEIRGHDPDWVKGASGEWVYLPDLQIGGES